MSNSSSVRLVQGSLFVENDVKIGFKSSRCCGVLEPRVQCRHLLRTLVLLSGGSRRGRTAVVSDTENCVAKGNEETRRLALKIATTDCSESGAREESSAACAHGELPNSAVVGGIIQ